MNSKPITPLTHALIDYAFSAVQILGPTVLGLDQKTIKTYAEIGASFLAVNSITDTGAAIQPVIDMETHKKIDSGFLVAQALMTFTPMVRKNKKTLIFHLGFLALTAANYFLTDYKKPGPTGPLESVGEDLHKGDNAALSSTASAAV
jgi:hypothetical protein